MLVVVVVGESSEAEMCCDGDSVDLAEEGDVSDLAGDDRVTDETTSLLPLIFLPENWAGSYKTS